jgi:hypothetical protein
LVRLKIVGSGVLRRLVRLEGTIGASEDDWVDVVMWSPRGGGIFGHVHYRFSKSRSESQRVPCSDEEEVQIMREHYEADGHRFSRQGDELSFPDYLERFSYLGSEELAERRREIISRVRGVESGI